MKRIEIIDKIKAMFGLEVEGKGTYTSAPVTTDLVDNDIPAWVNVLDAVSGITPTPPDPTPITAGTTATPLVIPYSGTQFPQYALIRGSNNSYDNNTEVDYDGTNFSIQGNDDGTGHFADDYTFYIRV